MSLKLHDFLKLHDEAKHPQALIKSLGDSYLYRHNPVFKNVRDEFLKLGFTLTDQDFCHYNVLPFASLATILKEKKVPYFDNVTVLKEIESAHPKKFGIHDLIKVKSNYTLHESSHCLADSFIKSLQLEDTGLSTEAKKAFKLVLAEAFANTVETIANLANDTNEKRLFFELNSYAIHPKKVNQILEQTTELLGAKLTFHLIYISYLYSNCLYTELNNKTYQQVIDAVIKDANLNKKVKESAPARKMFNHAFELSLDFRLQTTRFYGAFSGIQGDVHKLLQIDIISLYAKSKSIPNFLNHFNFIFE